MVPGAMMNTSAFNSTTDGEEEENEPPTKRMKLNISADSVSCRKIISEVPPVVDDISQLHREVLQLQRKKLLLSINRLERQVVEKCDASTQTQMPITDTINYTPYYRIL